MDHQDAAGWEQVLLEKLLFVFTSIMIETKIGNCVTGK